MTDSLLLALPLLSILLTMAWLRWRAATSALLAIAIALSVAWWRYPQNSSGLFLSLLPGSAAEAGLMSLTILWIIFAALAIHMLQQRSGSLASIQQQLARLHPDPKVSALFISWFFSLFMEGAAGFGTSAALTAPFLVSAGFGRVQAVILALFGHAVGVMFGAVGTPVLAQATITGFAPTALAQASILFALPGILILPLAMTRTLSMRNPGPALLTGVSFFAPFAALAWWTGPELPTLVGALAGALIFTLITRIWPTAFSSGNSVPLGIQMKWRPYAPYLVLICLVLITRLQPDLREALQSWIWQWRWGEFEASMQPAYHPGTLLFISFIMTAVIQQQQLRNVMHAIRQAALRLLPVAIALLLMLFLSRLMVHTGLIIDLGYALASASGVSWVVWAALVGLIGTFITGSATASNVLFSEFQMAAADQAAVARLPMLGAQNYGAALGNMVCPHNIIAAGATVQLKGMEGQVLRATLPVALLLVACGGVIALLLTRLVF
ncbi:L-lactate permease [Aliidiomarina sedimenti]|uniref:L-lactate permease n=1 Tax=Aliidiomarina sedimenti TaxID=1933879 RepID=A0ABY0C3B9_9GAMM|nr:L-lactate permease [Aliidiomarina sedimenti]RUO32087.1 L-lactate permease [Aliidiomarina sedimenti]